MKISKKMQVVVLQLALVLVLATPHTATPQMLTFDTAAFSQRMEQFYTQLMQYIQQIETAVNTFQTYYNTLMQLMNEAKHLMKLPKQIVNDIVGPIVQLKNDLMDLANFGNEFKSFVDEFNKTYSEFNFDGSGRGNFKNIANDVKKIETTLNTWRQKVYDASKKVEALEAEVTTDKLTEKTDKIEEVRQLINDSEGTLQALQGIGQLQAVQASQMVKLQQHIQALAKDQSTKNMVDVEKEGLNEEAEKNFWKAGTKWEF